MKRRAIESASAWRQRREIDGDQARAAGRRAPVGVQRIAFETGGHRQHAAARGRGAGDRREKAERLGVGPMDVLDRDEKRLAVCEALTSSATTRSLPCVRAAASIAS